MLAARTMASKRARALDFEAIWITEEGVDHLEDEA
jgi:hypothetical protein